MNHTDNTGFFETLRRAKEEFHTLTQAYPELSALSARELEVFGHLLTDKTLSEIAEEMIISYSAVHFHCKNIYKKLHLSSRKQLLIKYKDL